MISDEMLADRAQALLLHHDDVLTLGVFHHLYQRRYRCNEEELARFKSVTYKLTKTDVIIEYDSETEIADSLVVSHSRYGDLEASDLFFLGFEELIAIGPNFTDRLRRRSSEIMNQAAEGGLDDALARLRKLPIESWKWTGLEPNFEFTAELQVRVLDLLRMADREISSASNIDVVQAKAFIKAAIILAEAPYPQPDMVWEIIQRVSAIVGLLGAVHGLINLFRPVN